MRLDTLKDRIENAKTKIEKKGNTIDKKTALIEKKNKKLESMGHERDADPQTLRNDNEAFWIACDIKHAKEDIERLTREVEATKKSLEKYEAQLVGELEKESILLKEIPESMKGLQKALVTEWNEWDKKRRDQIWEDCKLLSHADFCKKYDAYERFTLRYMNDEQIEKANEQEAKMKILNLYYRVKDITGEVTDWEGIYLTIGNQFPVLNGIVIGKEGRANVESIYAGGYNIQRLHVRVLVHSI